MPQLNFSTYPSQFFWLCVSFLLMLFLMSVFILPKIRDILNQRQRKIDDYLSAANEFKTQVEEAVEKYDAAVALANAKAEDILAKAQASFEQLAAEKEAASAQRLAQKALESEQAIAGLKKNADAETEAMAADLASRIARKMGWGDISEEEIRLALPEENE